MAALMAALFLLAAPAYAHFGEFHAYKGFPLLAMMGVFGAGLFGYERFRDSPTGVAILANTVFVTGYISIFYTTEETLEIAPLLALDSWVPIIVGVIAVSGLIFATSVLRRPRARR